MSTEDRCRMGLRRMVKWAAFMAGALGLAISLLLSGGGVALNAEERGKAEERDRSEGGQGTVLFPAISGEEEDGEGKKPSRPSTRPATRTITGKRMWTYLPFNAATGSISPVSEPAVAGDPSTYIRALLLDGSSLPGTFNNRTGRFRIPNVPNGRYWLVRLNYDYLLTDKTSVDMSVMAGGRRDAATAGDGTTVSFNTTNLSPWQDGASDLQMFDYNSNMDIWPLERAVSGIPATGDTALSALSTRWIGHALADTAKGDSPTLIQQEEISMGSILGQVATRAYTPSSLQIQDGTDTVVGGAFSPIPQTTSVAIHFKASEFAAAQYPIQPNASVNDGRTRLVFFDAPGVKKYGHQGTARWSLNTYGQTADTQAGTIPAPALPRGFERFARGEIRHFVDIKAPGATGFLRFGVYMRTYTQALPTETSPMRPALGPVQAPQINGMSFFSNQAGVGLTPRVSWAAPAVGAPQGYVAMVYEVSTDGQWTNVKDVARIMVGSTQTEFQMPAGILQDGKHYVIRLEARQGKGYDIEGAPHLFWRLPYAFAQSLSGMITPSQEPSTVTISGNAGAEGVALSYTDGIEKTVTTDGAGNYSFTVPYRWSGTVTPAKWGFTFSPANRSYAAVTGDMTGEDYSVVSQPATLTISGNAGTAGAILSYVDGTAKTATADGMGAYRFQVSYRWSGAVTPSKVGYSFTPSVRIYNSLTSDRAGENYSAEPALTRTVTGTCINTYLPFDASTGIITPELQFSWNPAIRALLPDGTIIEGTYSNSTGTFSIPEVPLGHYYLLFDRSAIWTDRSQVDLGWKAGGRMNRYYATTAADLVFNISGMSPWNEANDYVQFYDFNAGIYADSYSASAGIPVEGDTTLNGLKIPWNDTLVDTSVGDSPIVVQMVTTAIGSEHVQIAKKAHTPSSLIMGDGTEATVEGEFKDLPLNASVTLNWNRSEFAAARSDVNDTVVFGSPSFYLSASPGLAAHGNKNTFEQLEFFSDSSSEISDVNLGEVAVPEPPPHFERMVFAGQSFRKRFQLPGTSTAWTFKGRASRVHTMTLPTADSPLKAMVSPPRNLRIGSSSLNADVTGVGVTPTLTWDAPTLGSPQGYLVYFREVYPEGATTASTYVGGAWTKETQFTIPPTFLETGKHYFFVVRAVVSEGFDPTAAPFGYDKFPYGWAENVSSLVTP